MAMCYGQQYTEKLACIQFDCEKKKADTKIKRLHCSGQSLSCARLFVTICAASCKASLSITTLEACSNTSIKLVMPSNHLILCRHLLLPSIFPSFRVFSNESVLLIKWPKCQSFSFNICPSSEYSGLISFRIDWLISLHSKGLLRDFSNTMVQKHEFFGAQLSLWSNSHIHT